MRNFILFLFSIQSLVFAEFNPGQSRQAPSRSVASESPQVNGELDTVVVTANSFNHWVKNLRIDDFWCNCGTSSCACDSMGQPISDRDRAAEVFGGARSRGLGGASSRPQLIRQCLMNSIDDPLPEDQLLARCSQQIDANMSPLNRINAHNGTYEDCRAKNPNNPQYCQGMGPGDNKTTDSDDQEKCYRNYDDQVLAQMIQEGNDPCRKGDSRDDGSQGLVTDTPCAADDLSQRCIDERNRKLADQNFQNCRMAGNNVVTSCNTEQQSWMKNINMVAQGVGPIMQQMNPDSCSTLAATNVGTSSSLAVFKTMCNTAATECEQSCKAVTGDNAAAAADIAKNCKQKGTKANEAEQQAVQATNQIMQAVQACQAAFGTTNPFENQANNPYQGKSAEEIMGNLTAQQGGGMSHGGVSGDGSGSSGSAERGGFGLDLEEEEENKVAKKPGSADGGAGDIGGAKGGSGAKGSGLTGGGGSNRRGQGVFTKLGNVLAGFFGGSGGGGLFGGGSRGGAGAGGGYAPNQAAVQQQPDLTKFMPKTAHKLGRGLASHGVSGAHGNIWKMINNRYQAKRATLLPR